MKVQVGTTATSYVDVPTKVEWKCSKCGADNQRVGTLRISRSSSSSLILDSKGDKAKEAAKQKLNEGFMEDMEGITNNPEKYFGKIDKGLNIMQRGCSQCGKVEVWAKGGESIKMNLLGVLCMFASIFGFLAFFPVGILLVLGMLYCWGGYKLIDKSKHKKLPKESLPKFTYAARQ